ncbi:MAG: hypothetical protein NAOJABEB_02978 [Steroidobacteraceae bacterium]|nr:hypothetical protein [Steroidobacteraceae bacterium]
MITSFADLAERETVEDEELVVTIDLTPVKGCPKVDPTKRARKALLPDGVHWVEIRGGNTAQERLWCQRVAEKADEIRQRDQIGGITWATRRFGTFLDGRIVSHNLVDENDDPLPSRGMELAFALGWGEMLRLVGLVTSPPSIFADPKAGRAISGGTPTDD